MSAKDLALNSLRSVTTNLRLLPRRLLISMIVSAENGWTLIRAWRDGELVGANELVGTFALHELGVDLESRSL